MTELEEKVISNASAAITDMKLEVVIIPVSDVDRAKEFYSRLDWRLDADRAAGEGFRLIQFTPPGSGTSIQFGVNLTTATPGSVQGLLLAVSDIEGARQQLVTRGVDVGEVFEWWDRLGQFCSVERQGTALEGRAGEFLDVFVHQQPTRAALYEGMGCEVQRCRFGCNRRAFAGVWFRERTGKREECRLWPEHHLSHPDSSWYWLADLPSSPCLSRSFQISLHQRSKSWPPTSGRTHKHSNKQLPLLSSSR